MRPEIPEHLREWNESAWTDNNPAKDEINCDCGVRKGKWTSWTDNNPARRFTGCRNYKDKNKDCKKFDWVDDELTDYYKGVILRLKDRADMAKDWEQRLSARALKLMQVTQELEASNAKAKGLGSDLEEMKLMNADLEFENRRLKEKNSRLRKDNNRLQIVVSKGEGKEQTLVVVIGFLVAVILMLVVLNGPVAIKMKMLP